MGDGPEGEGPRLAIRLLRPRLRVPSIYEIDLGRLVEQGIRALIVDLDNTLVAWNQMGIPADLAGWIGSARRHGLGLCIVSNNVGARVKGFADQIAVESIAGAAKPRTRGFRRAMQRLGTGAAQTAVVGDQLFTDIVGGNRVGCYTILVSPINQAEWGFTRLMRRLERWILRRAGEGADLSPVAD